MTTNDNLTKALTEVEAQLSRVDTKASMLLAGSLTAVSLGIALTAKVSLNSVATGSALATVFGLACAAALLITAVRPALGGNHGFVRWAGASTPTELLDDLNKTDRELAGYQAQRLLGLSRSVQRKYRLVRLATDLIRAALVLAVLTALLAVTL
ncbi:Pycsar system effector family protein [Actinoplanes sp. NPDC051411]|uniref:Pycsar system effector family protein n=1 Tax=Actinoplanes sp. NPDC051411 TaxID=3155522 RepID=UPI0034294B9D